MDFGFKMQLQLEFDENIVTIFSLVSYSEASLFVRAFSSNTWALS